MAGSIEEIPLPDLLQLLSTSKKSGVLVVHSDRHVGKTFFRKGQIYFASIENQFNIGPRKALTRMLSWTQGQFELEPPDETAVLEEMDDSTEGLLIEGMRQLDEYRVHAEKLPELSSPIGVARPLKAKLRDLSPEELDVFQAALEVKTVAAAVRSVAAHRPRRSPRSWSRCSKRATSSPASPPAAARDPVGARLVSIAGRRSARVGSCRSGALPAGTFRRGHREAVPMECLPSRSPPANQDPRKNPSGEAPQRQDPTRARAASL